MNANKLKCYVTCIGIKKRCRTADRHMFELGNLPLNADRETLKAMAKTKLLKEMRTISAAAMLHCDPVEVKDEGGFNSFTWLPFNEANERHALDQVAKEVANA